MEQREEKSSQTFQYIQKQRPTVELSDLYLNIEIESGKTYRGSFGVKSTNGAELEGKVISTNDKIVLDECELSGTECEIRFYFKGKLAMEGEEYYGDFLLITNGGEYNLPYHIEIVPKTLRIDDKVLNTLSQFENLAKEDWKTARELFFTAEFAKVFIHDDKKNKILYESLLKGKSKDVVLDNFLQETTGKKPLQLKYEGEEKIKLRPQEEKTIHLIREGWGCVEGRVYSKTGQLKISRDSFTDADFQDDGFDLTFSYGEMEKQGREELVIETVFQRITIPVFPDMEKNEHYKKEVSEDQILTSQLMRAYVELRTGNLSLKEYGHQSIKALEETDQSKIDSLIFELCEFQILVVLEQAGMLDREQKKEYKKLARNIEGRKELYKDHPLCHNYYLYLMALYKKERTLIMESAMEIRESYKKNPTFYNYWLLLYIDQKYALDLKGKYDRLIEYIRDGERSPLLYLEILDVLNQNPYYLEDLEDEKASCIAWGIRHGYISLELSRQFAKLTGKEKCCQMNLLRILIQLYKIRQDESYLAAICSMLIRGNKTQQMYHTYFEQALGTGIKLVGLNEYYLRSLDFSTYPLLPKSLLLYFQYSNSLNTEEKAYLYSDILYYKDQYDYIYQSYAERMKDFVKEQMIEGKISQYSQGLYEYFLPEILEEPSMIGYLPNIIFKKKITVSNPGIIGVFVCHEEIEEETYVPLLNGTGQVETFSEGVHFYFADEKGNRYKAGIEYQLQPYLNEDEYMELCVENNLENKKILLKWSNALGENRQGNEEVASRILETSGMKNWVRERAMEQVLDHHYEEKAMEELSECLDQINFKVISPSYRRTLIQYYMACNRMENAYFGIELYGSDLVGPDQLYLLTCVGLYLYKKEKDDLLLIMAQRTFINGKYNEDILIYLREYLNSRVFDQLALWTVLKEKGLETEEFEEHLLKQILFSGEGDERMLDVLKSYLDKAGESPLTELLLELYNIRYLIGKQMMTETYVDLIDQQVLMKKSLSDMSCLAYLYKKSETGFHVADGENIIKMLDQLCADGIVFPFYEKFERLYSVPMLFREMTWITLFSRDRKREELFIWLQNEDGQCRQETIRLREICEGFYIGGVYILEGEALKLGQDDEDIIRDRLIHAYQFEHKIETSRSRILRRMSEKKTQTGHLMKWYNEVLSGMEENLMIRTD